MATVVLSGSLKDHTGGVSQLEIEATNVRQLIATLGERFPALKPRLEKGLTVAIDGEVFHDAWYQTIPEKSEVHLLSAVAGG
jgi:molybdopterin synthase sulfur carrier subunit